MKNILTLLVISAVIFLASCGNGGNDSNIHTTPIPDSSSKGGFIAISFTNDSSVTEGFNIYDLMKNNWAVYALYASVVYNHTDSLWHCSVQLADQKSQQLGIIFNGTGASSIGDYFVTTNTCTVIDYSHGQNTTYTIAPGSSVNITQASFPIEGTINFVLYRNHFSTTATGNFKIYY